MAFFSQFPKIQYDLKETNQPSQIYNIFRHVDVTTVNTDDFTTYTFYEIQDGDRPDVISQKLYGTPLYYWTFFIVNDFLQAGYNEFHKSYQNLQRGLEIEYNPYGAIIFTRADSSFNGIDVTYDNLRIRRIGTGVDSTAKIQKWDSDMLQLITYEPSNSSQFYYEHPNNQDTDPTNDIYPQFHLEFNVPGTNENAEWIQEFNELRVAQGRSTITEETLSSVVFTGFDIYAELINAPWRYIAKSAEEGVVNVGDEIYAYDALVKGYGSSIGGDFISNFAHEVSKNDNNQQIRVINPLYIEEFAQEYRRLINL